jgi:acetyl esterase/lipase
MRAIMQGFSKRSLARSGKIASLGSCGEKFMRVSPAKTWLLLCALLAGAHAGAALGSGGSSTLLSPRIDRIATLSVGDLRALLRTDFPNERTIQRLIGMPSCAIHVYKFSYATIGGKGEATDASGALMVPAGAAARCRGGRPIVLYTHGTAIDRAEDMAAIGDPRNPAYGSSTRVALVFAAQGYIVVAPNYAGYDTSRLPYHPYLDRAQQSQDVIDGLTAGRRLLQRIGGPVGDGGKLFVTGYSQGGFVSMATLQALDERGHPATAGAPMSGPYALLAMSDEILLGHPDFGGTAYLPLVVNSYAHLEHGSIRPAQILAGAYRNAAQLFPGKVDYDDFSKLVAAGKIPESALLQSESRGRGVPGFSAARYPALAALPEGAPLYKAGFDPSKYLISTAFRAAYVADVDAHPDSGAPIDGSAPDLASVVPTLPANPQSVLRQDLKRNDLRNYTPSMPLLMCGGFGDPEVFWNQGAGAMTAVLQSKVAAHPTLRFATLDLDVSAGTQATYLQHGLHPPQNAALQSIAKQLQTAFTAYQQAVDRARGAQVGLEAYHTDEVPYCMVAARTFFEQF